MDSRQRLIDDVARQCGPSVVVLNLGEVQERERSTPMVTSHPCGVFTDVDQSADPGGFVRVLDALTALDFIRAYKRRLGTAASRRAESGDGLAQADRHDQPSPHRHRWPFLVTSVSLPGLERRAGCPRSNVTEQPSLCSPRCS
jgi:hypothetical protein